MDMLCRYLKIFFFLHLGSFCTLHASILTASFSISDTLCLNQPVSFSDSSFGGCGIIAWHWDFGDGNTDTVQSPAHLFAVSGVHGVMLTVFDACGDSATKALIFTVHGSPLVTLNVDSSFCLHDEPALLIGSGTDGFYTGTVLDSIGDYFFAPGMAGVGEHLVSYTVVDTMSGCSSTETKLIEVSAPDSLHILDLSSVQCLTGDPDTFLLSPPGYDFAHSGFVVFDDSLVVGQGVFYPALADTSVTYLHTYSGYCAIPDTLWVTVESPVKLTFSGLDEDYCSMDEPVTLMGNALSGESFSLVYLGGASGPPMTFEMSGGEFNPAGAVFDAADSMGYFQVHYSASGCVVPDTQEISIWRSPDVKFLMDSTIHLGHETFCLNSPPSVFMGLDTPSGGEGSYFTAPGYFQPDEYGMFDLDSIGEFLIGFNYSYQYGEGADAHTCTTFIEQVFTVLPLPEVSLEIEDSLFCANADAVPIEVIIVPDSIGTGMFLGDFTVYGNQFIPGDLSSSFPDTGVIRYMHTDIFGCSNTDSQLIYVLPIPELFEEEIPEWYLCKGEEITFSTPHWADDYIRIDGEMHFSDGPTEHTVHFPSSGEYELKWERTDNNGCSIVLKEIIQVNVSPVPNAGPDISGFRMEEVRLDAVPPGLNMTGTWIPASRDTLDIADLHDPNSLLTLNPVVTGAYTLIWEVVSPGCEPKRDSLRIIQKSGSSCGNLEEIFIPEGFSPGPDDNLNDKFRLLGLENYSNAEMRIFNKTGALVFQDNHYTNNWEGQNLSNRPLPDDTYYYLIQLTRAYGEDPKVCKGFITLRR